MFQYWTLIYRYGSVHHHRVRTSQLGKCYELNYKSQTGVLRQIILFLFTTQSINITIFFFFLCTYSQYIFYEQVRLNNYRLNNNNNNKHLNTNEYKQLYVSTDIDNDCLQRSIIDIFFSLNAILNLYIYICILSLCFIVVILLIFSTRQNFHDGTHFIRCHGHGDTPWLFSRCQKKKLPFSTAHGFVVLIENK